MTSLLYTLHTTGKLKWEPQPESSDSFLLRFKCEQKYVYDDRRLLMFNHNGFN